MLDDSFGRYGTCNSTFSDDELPSAYNGDANKVDGFETDVTTEEQKIEKRRMWRSLLCNAISLNLNFSVMMTLTNSVTSLLPENNIGNISLTISYAAQLLATMFVLVIANLFIGIKTMLIVATFLMAFYTAALFYPVFELMVPLSIGWGISAAISIVNGFAYNGDLGYWYHTLYGGNIDTILSFFSGTVWGSLGGGFVWGNLIYYQVLKQDYDVNATNATDFSICGAAYCNEDLGVLATAKLPPPWRVHVLIYIFLGLLGMTLLLQLFMVNKIGHSDISREKLWEKCVRIIKTNFYLLLNPRSFLLVIVTFFLGMEEQFAFTVYTNAYVNCALGIEYIGYAMFNFGIAQIVLALTEGLFVQLVGRPAVVVISFLVFLGIFTTLLVVPASQISLIAYCIIAFLYGATDSLLATAVFSLYARLFPDNLEGSFSLATMWFSVGGLIGNSTIPYSCVYVKLYSLIAIGTVGVTCFLLLEYVIYKKYFKL